MAASSCLSPFFFFSCLAFTAFFFLSHGAGEPPPFVEPPPHALHFAIRRDDTTHQYWTAVEMGHDHRILDVVIDLGGQFLWFNCDEYKSTYYRPIPCGTAECEAAKGSGCVGCNAAPRPGCTNDTCGVYGHNSISNLVAAQGLGRDTIYVSSTNGYYVSIDFKVPNFHFSCAAGSYLLKGLTAGTKGMVGLGRSQTTLPIQVASPFNLPPKFALCLPSSSADGMGDLFIGGGAYYMPPSTVDLSGSLTLTPLLINPVSTAPVSSQGDPSDEYFLDVKSIRVGGTQLASFDASLLAIDNNGVGGVKLSTITPYTILHTSIYKALVGEFVKKATAAKIKRVTSVAPFGACFSAKTITNSTQTGPAVPNIDLALSIRSGSTADWTIYGANSMVKVKKKNGVLCLAFVDGGSKPRTSVVLGGYQLENYLFEFDLSSSILGFSTSLLLHNTSCSHNRYF